MKPLIVVCAWCADAAAQTQQALQRGGDVTHGLCPACAATFDHDAADREELI
jgi:hypothetical protein